MDPQEWLACTDPEELIDYHTMKTDKRRLRLLAVACVRLRFAERPPVDPAIAAVFTAVEQFADGGDRAEFLAARKAVRKLAKETRLAGLWLIERLTDDAMEGMTVALSEARGARPKKERRLAECHLIRDVFNPYLVVDLAPAWLTPTVVGLAQAAYAERPLPTGQFERDRLLVLADALEDAGCTEQALLDHLRQPTPHVRGCAAVDRVLGKG